MSPDEQQPPSGQRPRSDRQPPFDHSSLGPPDEIPLLEDAFGPGETQSEVVPDDEAAAPDHSARALGDAVADSAEGGEPATRKTTTLVAEDSDSDTNDMVDGSDGPPVETFAPVPSPQVDWEYEVSAHNVVVELKRVELEVRRLLEERDPRRKRKLSGTYRWRELEDEIRSWHYTGRFDEAALSRLSQLVNRRHHLFRRLRFLASTRPTWNT